MLKEVGFSNWLYIMGREAGREEFQALLNRVAILEYWIKWLEELSQHVYFSMRNGTKYELHQVLTPTKLDVLVTDVFILDEGENSNILLN